MDTGVLIIAWIVSGVIGLVLGAIVDKLGAGFFLGLLLGPIGWIIVFLLPRDTQTQVANAESTPASKPTSSRPERNLDSDAYKIWLGKQYNITKNDLFDKYECDEKLFATLDEALDHANALEASKRGEATIDLSKPRTDDVPDWRIAANAARKDLEER